MVTFVLKIYFSWASASKYHAPKVLESHYLRSTQDISGTSVLNNSFVNKTKIPVNRSVIKWAPLISPATGPDCVRFITLDASFFLIINEILLFITYLIAWYQEYSRGQSYLYFIQNTVFSTSNISSSFRHNNHPLYYYVL